MSAERLWDMKIIYCMMGGEDRDVSITTNVQGFLPYVDHFVLVNGGDKPFTVESWDKVIPVYRRWDDSFVKQRNAYIQKAGEILGRQPGLLCVSDDDEVYSKELLESLRSFAEYAWQEDLNTLCIRAHDVTLNRKNEVIHESLSDWYKPLIFVYEPGMHYIGVGQSEVHEHLIMPSGSRAARVNDQSGQVVYSHYKVYGVIWPRATRNFFAGGGGMNMGESQPLWRPFREMIKRLTDIERSPDFLKYLEAGNIHQEVKDWFIKYRLEGTNEFGDHEGRKDVYDGASEIREGFLAYYIWFNPFELPYEIYQEDLARGYKDYLAEITLVHGEEIASQVRQNWKSHGEKGCQQN